MNVSVARDAVFLAADTVQPAHDVCSTAQRRGGGGQQAGAEGGTAQPEKSKRRCAEVAEETADNRKSYKWRNALVAALLTQQDDLVNINPRAV